jgi:hypothetical protein
LAIFVDLLPFVRLLQAFTGLCRVFRFRQIDTGHCRLLQAHLILELISNALCRLLQAVAGLGSFQQADAGFNRPMNADAGFCKILQASVGISDVAGLCGLMQTEAGFYYTCTPANRPGSG